MTALDTRAPLDAALAPGALRTLLQPVVRLDDEQVVGWEALTRGPAGGPLERPDLLFAAARAAGRTAELDLRALATAVDSALAAGVGGDGALLLNAEPEGLAALRPGDLAAERRRLEAAGVRVVLEVTERALTTRPAELLRAVRLVRTWGWSLALDDVGADRASLALLPLLAPDVVKLDLRLVQERSSVETAAIVNAVRAHAERTGALLLAEGIETAEHAELARALGADYGQGWRFGRPGAGPVGRAHPLPLPSCSPPPVHHTPWQALAPHALVRASAKPLLLAMSTTLERQALVGGESVVVVGTFQQARFFTPRTARRYAGLAREAALVAALAVDLPEVPADGVRGTALAPGDPLVQEWDLAVVGPHFAAALVAHDDGDTGPEAERRFRYVLTYDRDTALSVAASLLARVRPDAPVLPRQGR